MTGSTLKGLGREVACRPAFVALLAPSIQWPTVVESQSMCGLRARESSGAPAELLMKDTQPWGTPGG
jgi:hypothetical protein